MFRFFRRNFFKIFGKPVDQVTVTLVISLQLLNDFYKLSKWLKSIQVANASLSNNC